MDLLIDIDDTLLDFKKSEAYALGKVLEKYNIPCTNYNLELYSEINLSYWKKFELNQISRADLLVQRYVDYFHILGVKVEDYSEVNRCYFSFLKNAGFPFDDTFLFLDKCKEMGIRLYACSNGEKNVQKNRLEVSGIKNYFNQIFISEDIGLSKPNKEYFDFVLKTLSLKAGDVYMLGDSLTSDIKGAKNAGIKSVWINKKGESSSLPDYEIHSLSEFFSLDLRW